MKSVNQITSMCIFVIMLYFPVQIFGQTLIKGNVKDEHGNAVAYATVMLKNSSDGTSTDTAGNFSFKTKFVGEQVLLVSFIGYEQLICPIKLDDKEQNLNLTIKENSTELSEVVISAGTIEARNDRVVAVLKPIDIVTSAGCNR